jgi:hypothetical protein
VDAKQIAPLITLEQISAQLSEGPGYWNIMWKVKNLAARPLALLAVRLPHGQFKAAEQRFDPTMDLASNEQKQFTTLVQCDEPPGLVTENAFVILQIKWRGAPWRIFVRVRVIVNKKGEPNATTELITTQKVGFTGVVS